MEMLDVDSRKEETSNPSGAVLHYQLEQIAYAGPSLRRQAQSRSRWEAHVSSGRPGAFDLDVLHRPPQTFPA